MCGIFGCVVEVGPSFSEALLERTIARLYRLSESRGKEASGLAVRSGGRILVHKEPKSASHLIKTETYRRVLQELWRDARSSPPRQPLPAFIGHARLTTSGLQGITTNNQPVIREGVVGVHNGIIVNVDELWERFPQMERKYDVDTEVFMALLGSSLDQGASLDGAVRKTFSEIQGSASVALLFRDYDSLLLATNTGSLYVCRSQDRPAFIFASERYILTRATSDPALREALGRFEIEQVRADEARLVDLNSLSIEAFSIREESARPLVARRAPARREIVDTLDEDREALESMRRCTKCLLPETFPFITFDNAGVCNYCHSYSKIPHRGAEALEKAVAPFRSENGEPDCLVAFSGGRDSSYCLHYLKTVLGLNPIAYTYDWGMVNDLARRNQARVTGCLGVEQILISADIKRKRQNIGKNVRAWLKRPDLGMVPLFMAGDKHFFYYANRLRQQTGIKLFVWAENQLERTNFKVGFCGIPAGNKQERIYTMSASDKAALALHYLKNFATNPAYLNRSLFDTAFAYVSYYFIPHDYLWFYDYIPWEEDLIGRTLREDYDWETSKDTQTTWRIGDETAAFYNYIYGTIAGFTENDTFRSNQIREGLIHREEALTHVLAENQPRYDSIREYLQLINVDFDEAMSVINSVPKLYRKPK